MNMKKIGEFIAYNRKNKGLTQEQLGEKLGVSNKTISRWENGNYMPDLSLLKPLSDVLGITLNELLSGEKIEKENIAEASEKSLKNTIDYTNRKIDNEHRKISFILMALGIILSFAAFLIFDSESNWCSLYSLLGVIIFVFGVFREINSRKIWKRAVISAAVFIVISAVFFAADYIGTVVFKRPPIYRYMTVTTDIITYKAPFYNVYRINADTSNEYYIIDTEKKYTNETVPKSVFDRNKSGIESIIKYKSKYIGDNSNTGSLIEKLPLSEYGYVFEIDSENFGLTVNYNTTDWYGSENLYIQKSLIYNSVSIFSLIENAEYIQYNFSGSSYKTTRKSVEENYPDYLKITANKTINEHSFNEYAEKRLNDSEFAAAVFEKLFAD